MTVTVRGQGLHSAAPSAVRFVRSPGPVRVRRGAEEAAIAEMRVVGTLRSTTIARGDGALRIATVEHLLAAFAGASIRSGMTVELEGPEVPLVDGGALAFLEALLSVGAPPEPPSLRVARSATFEEGASRYTFEPAEEPSLEVEVDLGDPELARAARWDGALDDFRARFAPARTFGFEREIAELLERGLASHVSPESVVVLGRGRVLAAGRPFEPDEPARHKLLDLAGDLYLYGGPPRGRTLARRPGHAATHAVVRRALEAGVLVAGR